MFDAVSLHAPDPMLLVDEQGSVSDANHAAAKAFGHSRTALRRLTIAELGDSRVEGRFTARYRRADGTHFACEVNCGRVGEAGPVLCILRTLEPRTVMDLYAQSFRKSPVYVSIVNLSDNTFVDVNDAWLASTGFTREQVIGKTFLDLGIKLTMEDILKVGRAVLNEDSTPVELRTTSANGQVNDALQTHQFVEFDDKRCVIAFGIDIAAQKRLEAELRQAQKMEAVGRLAGGVAHDFNNILTAILGHAEMVLHVDEPSAVRRHAEQLRKSALRASSLTGQLLAFSRKHVLQARVLDMNELVSNLCAMLSRIIGEDIDLVPELATDPVCVKADRSQLEQVVLNLAINAREAMPHGGRLTLRTSCRDDRVLLEVIDTGIGMNDDVRAHLFEPFFTTKTDGRGTGLGLSTAHGIVTRSAGHIEADSAPGEGATFRVFLPRIDERPDGEHLVPQRTMARGQETVLLVENDHDVRGFISELLATQGYTVMVATDGHDALRLATENAQPIHLLVSDVIMPRMNGPELAGRLKVLRPKVRTLFITGYPGDALAARDRIDPTTPIVQKPFTVSHLAQSIRAVLDA